MNTIQIHGTKVQISREGVQTVSVLYYVQGYSQIDNIPKYYKNVDGGGNKLALVNISASQAEEGLQYLVWAVYEGLANESLVQKSYEWTPEEAEQPIIINPNIKLLWEKYGASWDDDLQSIKWPRTTTDKKGKETENPMTGVESWLDLYGSWSETEVMAELETDVLAGTWSLTDAVPGGFPTPKNRLWFVLPPEVTQRGACWQIRRRWRLTGVMTPERLEATRLIYTPVT